MKNLLARFLSIFLLRQQLATKISAKYLEYYEISLFPMKIMLQAISTKLDSSIYIKNVF